MAAIVRVSRFTGGLLGVRRLVCPSLSRHLVSHQNVKLVTHKTLIAGNGADLTVRRLCASAASPIINAQEKPSSSKEVQPSSGSSLDEQLAQLDSQVRRWGRIDKEQVLNLLDLVSKAGKVSTQQSIMVLRCTGALLMKESSSERNAMFDKAWNVLQSAGAEINVQVYNAALRAKLENKQPFSPEEILAKMETESNLVPNRVTYQLLLAAYCETGNIESASTILEHMKSQNLPVNENIFNALVKGHVVKGDFDGAKSIMTSMSEGGMDPTGETYKTLMCGFAEKGDMANIKQCLADAEKASVRLFPRHLFDVIISLVQAGHNKAIDEIVSYIQRQTGYNQDALNCIFQLVANGHDDEALKIYNCMDKSRTETQQEQSRGSVLLRVMIIKGRPIDKVIEFQKALNPNNASGSLEEIANMALRYQHSGYAMQVMEKVKERGADVKQHYFWPILKDAAEHHGLKGVTEAVVSLIKCTKGQNEVVAGTIFRWAVKPLLFKGESLETILSGLKTAGLSEAEVGTIRGTALVATGEFDDAAKLVAAGTRISPGVLKSEVVNGFFKADQKPAGLVKILKEVEKQMSTPLVDLNSGVLLGILRRRLMSKEVTTNLIEEWAKADLKVFKNFEVSIKRELNQLTVPSETVKKLDNLFYMSPQLEQIPLEEMRKASVEQVESWLNKAKEQKIGRTANLERWLLSKYCRAGMVDQTESLKKSMDNRSIYYGPELLRQLGSLAAKEKGHLEEALAYKKQLESQHPSFEAYAVLVLHIAQLQLKLNKFDDALNTLKEYSSQHLNELQQSGVADGYMLSDQCTGLLRTSLDLNDPSKTSQLCDALFDNGYVKKGTFSLINEVMNAYIKKGDPDELLNILQFFVTSQNKAPHFSDIFHLLIQNEDADRLQKAVDLVAVVHGEQKALLYLAVSFVECNKVRQARKILQTENLKALMKPLVDGCERFLNLNKEKELEQLVDITKRLRGIDRDEMLLQLMRFHAKQKNTTKMMEVFSLYEEERVTPRPRTLRYVAKVLENHGLPVPFDVPTAEQAFQESSRVVSSELEAEAQKALEAQDIAKVIAIKEEMDAKGEELSVKFAVSVARVLLNRKDNQLFQKFCIRLADSGDTDCLLAIRKLPLTRNMNNFVHQRLFLAYLNRNKVEEILDYLEKNPVELPKYLTTSAVNKLHEKRPELVPELISIIESHLQNNQSIAPAGPLYNFYMINGKTKEVEELFQKFPNLRDRVRLSYVCQMAKTQQKEDILHQVIEIHRSDSQRRLIVPYNQLLLLKCDQGDWSNALEFYQTAIANGFTFDNFWVRTLQTVASLLEKNGQPLPWQPGMLEKRASSEDKSRQKKRVSSSSEDSSSSDSEAEVPAHPSKV